MGHWEQTGVNNMRYRERQARKSGLRRWLEKGAIWCAILFFCVAFWAVVALQIWNAVKDLPLL
jgi:hypothetical protein